MFVWIRILELPRSTFPFWTVRPTLQFSHFILLHFLNCDFFVTAYLYHVQFGDNHYDSRTCHGGHANHLFFLKTLAPHSKLWILKSIEITEISSPDLKSEIKFNNCGVCFTVPLPGQLVSSVSSSQFSCSSLGGSESYTVLIMSRFCFLRDRDGWMTFPPAQPEDHVFKFLEIILFNFRWVCVCTDVHLCSVHSLLTSRKNPQVSKYQFLKSFYQSTEKTIFRSCN